MREGARWISYICVGFVLKRSKETLVYVGDVLGLYVRFEDARFEFRFVGIARDGTLGEIEVHVDPFIDFL